jgi:hypothetical protein
MNNLFHFKFKEFETALFLFMRSDFLQRLMDSTKYWKDVVKQVSEGKQLGNIYYETLILQTCWPTRYSYRNHT